MSHLLPLEIIFAILEHGYYSHTTGLPDHAFLCCCSLVCSSWSAPAQSLLFRITTNLTSYTAPKFYAAIVSSTAQGKNLGAAVRSLEISVGHSAGGNCHSSDLPRLLQACPRLYELCISIYGLHSFDTTILAELETAGQGIRSLHLKCCGVQSPVLFQLLQIWPSIRFLKIGTEIAAWPWRTTGIPRDTSVRLETRLGARAALYDLVLARNPSLEVLRWLLASSSPSLRILDLREALGAATRKVLEVHAPFLRSLRLLHYNSFVGAFLRQCTGLDELVLYHVPTILAFNTFCGDLPRSIEHLSFRNPSWAYVHTLRPFLQAVDVLPKLRMLTCDANSEALDDFVILRAKCVQKGVEIVVSDVPMWVHEDPVIVTRFPRNRSVSNFGLMSD